MEAPVDAALLRGLNFYGLQVSTAMLSPNLVQLGAILENNFSNSTVSIAVTADIVKELRKVKTTATIIRLSATGAAQARTWS